MVAQAPVDTARIRKILNFFKKSMPDAECELVYKTPFQLLCSVVLSAQTTDVAVNKCMTPLYKTKTSFTPKIVVRWGQEKILEKIRTIGLAPTKSKNLVRLSKIILDKHNGEVPSQREFLEELPGVGRKTANVVLAEIFGQPTLAVDTHVFRVTARLGMHEEKNALKCEQVLMNLIPTSYLPAAHHWFILHGRYVCKARNPQCQDCAISRWCPSKDEDL